MTNTSHSMKATFVYTFLSVIYEQLCQLYSLKQPAWLDQRSRLKKVP